MLEVESIVSQSFERTLLKQSILNVDRRKFGFGIDFDFRLDSPAV
jgi:hypothetical protein